MARRNRRFTPYRPPLPPAGTYDPSLDAQEAAARRGLADLTQDIETQGQRGQVDYGLNVGEIQRDAENNWRDLQRDATRSWVDIETQKTRGGEDYQQNLANLQRKYDIMGRNQLQAGNVAGVLRGGAMLQAAAKRAENQALERKPLDTNYQRFVSDANLRQSRLNEDLGTAVTRNEQARDLALGRASLGFSRGGFDLNQQLTRARRENTAYGLDIASQRAYQAAGTGWDPGQGPSNQFTNAQGQTYQIVREGNQSIAYLPSGQVLWRRPRRG